MTRETVPNYRLISLHSLRLDTVLKFDMYLKYAELNREVRFVLYRKGNVVFTERILINLTEHGTDELYIDASDKQEYQLYLENNLDAIIADDSIPLPEKSQIAYTCASGLVEELLENPRSGEHVRRSKATIINLADYILNESKAFFSLMATTSFDYYTYTHSVNVAVFGIALADKLGEFSREEINTIGLGLIVHDIGKGLIDQRILNKQGPLNKNEWAVMKEHPENGARMLRDSGQLGSDALVIVTDHHEKLDGSGYPRGLRGDAVLLYARIAAMVDIFDALTTRRPYRLAEKSFPALHTMREEMSNGLDQDIFMELVRLLGADTKG